MPYNIPNESPSQTAKMERCVSSCMQRPVKEYQGRSKKESCIAICKASIMGTTAHKRGNQVESAWKGKK